MPRSPSPAPSHSPVQALPFPRRRRRRTVLTALSVLAATACRLPGQGPAAAPLPRVSASVATARGIDLPVLQERLDRVLQQAIRDSAFPGAVALVGSRAGILAQSAVGTLDAADPAVPNERTLWDLASLTKVVGMTSGVLRLVQDGMIDLDAPVQRYLPEWTGAGKEKVTVRHLLSHSSGLPSWRPLYKEATSPAQALALVFATPLDTVPGARMVYSDLGAILAGQVVTRVSGTPFNEFVTRHVFRPLGMRETAWRPAASLGLESDLEIAADTILSRPDDLASLSSDIDQKEVGLLAHSVLAYGLLCGHWSGGVRESRRAVKKASMACRSERPRRHKISSKRGEMERSSAHCCGGAGQAFCCGSRTSQFFT